jgi:uncharacterized protein YbjT (DUF2867 family)
MQHKVVITGATGMVGKGVLLECLDSSKVAIVLAINRTTLNIKHQKLKEILIDDFFNLNEIEEDLKGYDACFFALGISSAGVSEDKYKKITYELTMNFAQVFLNNSKNSVFCYVTGAGTDTTEKGRISWARIKGKTENDLLKLSFKAAYMFRPGYIQPLRGIKSRTKWVSFIYLIFSPIYFILKHFSSAATNTTNIGKAMINTIDQKNGIKIYENKDINKLANY